MKKQIDIVTFKRNNQEKSSLELFNLESAFKVKNFHESFDQYTRTPLRSLDSLSNRLGVSKIFVKDESYRFGLNAFKVLGGSYAIGKLIANRLNKNIEDLPYNVMISEEVKKELGDITFVTATDGNHGKGIAWAANVLNQKSVVYMPKGSSKHRLDRIIAEGAEASITDVNYDEAVRIAIDYANKNNGVVIQDTAWEGYKEIPEWIMQGYATMALEAYEQLNEIEEKPTHMFIQAGVGSLAGAVQGFFASVYGDERPLTTIVEPNVANCIFKTAKANDGNLHFVTGEMNTIMAGLACGEPNKIGWDILKNYSDSFVSCPDNLSAKGIRVLAAPIGKDKKVIAGESGSIGVGLVAEIMMNPELKNLKEKLKLNKNSKILFFNTEGDTDPDSYEKIVWDGAFSNIG